MHTQHTCTCTYIHMHMFTHTCTVHVHTHIHTYTSIGNTQGRVTEVVCAGGIQQSRLSVVAFSYYAVTLASASSSNVHVHVHLKLEQSNTLSFFFTVSTLLASSWSTPFCEPTHSKSLRTNPHERQVDP